MYSHSLYYFPVAFPFLFLFVGLFVGLVILFQLHLLHFAYVRLGISPSTALALLLASLIGSYINIPITHLAEQRFVTEREIEYFGMRYVVPAVADWPGTIIAVNVGGAVIPTLLSFYLLIKNTLWSRSIIATTLVALCCHMLAEPVPGVGIAIPALAPPFITAVFAFLIAMGAPVASIGGAGTFDGIFLTGIIAVLLASFATR